MTRAGVAIAGVAWLVAVSPGGASQAVPPQAVPQAQEQSGAAELLFDQGKLLFDQFQYDQAVPLFDRLIQSLTAGGPGAGIPKLELLLQVYELRARARFAQGDSPGAEQDFSALLALKPDFKLGAGVSPRVISVFENVRRMTIGQLSIQLTPPGDVLIDGRRVSVTAEPMRLDINSGEHLVNATRPNYTAFEQKVTVKAGEVAVLAIVLERTSASIAVVSTPEDVEVFLDDVSKGRTAKGATAGVSAPLTITDVPLGAHKLRLKRECFVDMEVPLTLRAEDVQTDPLQLTPAVATLKIQSTDKEAVLVVDGQVHGPVLGDVTVCAGAHVIEIRGAQGRFVDRREWKTGDAVTLAAELKPAVPIVIATAGSGMTPDRLRAALEKALAPAKHLLVYSPVPSELEAAMRQENIPADWLNPAPGDAGQRLPKEVIRDMGRRLAARLGVQGLAAANVGSDSASVTFMLLAAGSAEPDVLTLSLADVTSQGRAAERLSTSPSQLVRASLDAAFIDVDGTPGAVVARTNAASGLALGDVVTSAAGKPVASVSDLRAAILAQSGSATTLSLEAKGAAGAVKKVASPLTNVVDTLPVRDPAVLPNRALLDLQSANLSATAGIQKAATAINLAVVHLRLGNWEDALAAVKDVQATDGAGVSAGTIAYLTGLAFEGLGRPGDAQAAFTRAAASPQARLWFEGPLVAPLATAKLQNRR
ncbi:MAG: PEGA domain-containing protein [Vicinamibacterales bacterium]